MKNGNLSGETGKESLESGEIEECLNERNNISESGKIYKKNGCFSELEL